MQEQLPEYSRGKTHPLDRAAWTQKNEGTVMEGECSSARGLEDGGVTNMVEKNSGSSRRNKVSSQKAREVFS